MQSSVVLLRLWLQLHRAGQQGPLMSGVFRGPHHEIQVEPFNTEEVGADRARIHVLASMMANASLWQAVVHEDVGGNLVK